LQRNKKFVKLLEIMRKKEKDHKVAVLLSLLFPGLGHFFLGKYFDGSGYVVAAGILWTAVFFRSSRLMVINPVSLLFWFAMAAVYFYAAADCYRKAKSNISS